MRYGQKIIKQSGYITKSDRPNYAYCIDVRRLYGGLYVDSSRSEGFFEFYAGYKKTDIARIVYERTPLGCYFPASDEDRYEMIYAYREDGSSIMPHIDLPSGAKYIYVYDDEIIFKR